MKLLQKSLLFATILGIGASVTSIPTVTNSNVTVQAATKKSTKTSSTKNMSSDKFYYRVGKDQYIKATDVKILTNENATDENMYDTTMDESTMATDFRLEVTSPSKAKLYNSKGKKISRTLSNGTVCKIGNQNKFDESTYYMESKNKLSKVADSTSL